MHRSLWPLALVAAACSSSSPSSSPAPPAPPAPSAPAAASAAPPEPPCRSPEGVGVTLFTSPRAPRAGAPLRVLAVAASPLSAALSLRDAAGADVAGARERRGGLPSGGMPRIEAPAAGTYRVALRGGDVAACAEVRVAEGSAPDREPRAWGGAWASRAAWTAAVEGLYSAWIEKLFDAPLDQQLTFPALHEVLRDPARNLLHNHLGQGEDDGGPHAPPIAPDCADLPYFLRAYFAYKLGLPFGFSSCTRGGGGLPPRCRSWHSNLEPAPQRATAADTFVDFLRIKVANTVHSGTGRTPADEDGGDYYPVPLSFASLRPGTVYADPYGHVLVVAGRVAQTAGAGGILLAVDGQPDGTVARRRFWRGNFLFALDPALGSAGFKRFRPVVVDASGRPRPLDNREIAAMPGYGDVSLAQYGSGVEGFYDAMDDLLSPSPLDPARALGEAVAALEEQVKGRVLSVANARKHLAAGGGRIDMPEGAAIFETTGPWEDFSTPSRDLRLLIAVNVVRGFPNRVARRPERFAMPAGEPVAAVKADLERLLHDELDRRRFAYERSDGSSFSLSLADVLARAADLEMAYNPNDCAEARWGAPAGSDGDRHLHAPGARGTGGADAAEPRLVPRATAAAAGVRSEGAGQVLPAEVQRSFAPRSGYAACPCAARPDPRGSRHPLARARLRRLRLRPRRRPPAAGDARLGRSPAGGPVALRRRGPRARARAGAARRGAARPLRTRPPAGRRALPEERSGDLGPARHRARRPRSRGRSGRRRGHESTRARWQEGLRAPRRSGRAPRPAIARAVRRCWRRACSCSTPSRAATPATSSPSTRPRSSSCSAPRPRPRT